MTLGAVGLVLLTLVPTENGLFPIVVASVIVSLGIAPVFGLTTELIVGSAPPERSGAASGISETGAELGGALGLALLGSIGVAIYRSDLARSLPAGLPADVVSAARDTLGGAVGVARGLPASSAGPLLEAARDAFVQGMHAAAAIAAVVGVGLAVFAFATLRDQTVGEASAEAEAEHPVRGRAPQPARECF
jgi:DHA2 family multidrug resistance protein-like MFS transporter